MTDEPGRDVRDILTPGAAVLLPGAANALTARVIEDAGFSALYVTGAGIANTYLGMPDIGLTTATEVADHVWRIRDAVSIPLIVDADTGYGNALNVQRTVRLLERAGAGAIQLEDQVFPKRCGHFEGKDVIPATEMVKKIQAAVDARQRETTCILARTDAHAIEGLSGALERAAMYREAGADLLFVEAPQTAGELGSIPSRVPGRHICNLVFGGKTPLLPREQLAEMGYAAVLYANAALQAAVKAMARVLGHLHSSGSLAGMEDALVSFEERQRMINHPRFKALEERFTVR
jgi:2-methylisocitrate lyase-like PEP mutase family enzyme